MHQRATAVVNAPLAAVEELVLPVVTWTRFLPGLEAVERTAHCRYRFRIRQDDRIRDMRVAVIFDRHQHCVNWRSFEDAAWNGRIRLEPVGDRRTRVTVDLRIEPWSFTGRFADMFHGGDDEARAALHRLADQFAPATV